MKKPPYGGFCSFKAWVPAFAGTTGLSGGLRQKSPNPPYMN
jgi:hypothetical protein